MQWPEHDHNRAANLLNREAFAEKLDVDRAEEANCRAERDASLVGLDRPAVGDGDRCV
jgi:hypothetical protein